MKVGATNNTIAEVDCLAAQIPLQGGFSPAAWQNAIDVMIPKNQELLFIGIKNYCIIPCRLQLCLQIYRQGNDETGQNPWCTSPGTVRK
jgi:hypothetical protein